MVRPNGYNQIVKTYGDPLLYVEDKPAWENLILLTRRLPVALPYAYLPTNIDKIRAHRQLVDLFVEGLVRSQEYGAPVERIVYGGIYCWRPMVGGNGKLSVHTFGAAIDIDPVNNPRGTKWVDDGKTLHPAIIRAFTELGFVWGNGFPTPDPMHFQYASGY